MGTKINLYKQSGTDDGTSVNFNVPRSLTYGLNARANDDGGVTESDNCEYNILNTLYGINYEPIPIQPETAAYLAATGITGTTEVNAINKLVYELKQNNLWSKMKAVYPFVTDNRNLFGYSENFSTGWTNTGATVTSNSTIAPDGTLTADTIEDTDGIYARLQQTISVEALTYTMSIYIKKTSATPTSYSGFEVLGKGTYLIFNSTTGSFSESGGLNYTTSVTSVDASWWRLSIRTTAASGSRVCSIFPAISTDGTTINPTATGSIVAWGAQLELGSTATTYQPIATAQQAYISSQFKYNLVNPVDSDAAFRLVFNGGWTHSSNGATPNGTNGYADTKLNSFTNLTQTSISFGIYYRSNAVSVSVEGTYNGDSLSISPRGTQTYFSVGSYGTIGPIVESSLGLKAVVRNGSSLKSYINSTQNGTATNSVNCPSLNMYLGALNNSGASGFYSSNQESFSFIGDGLSDSEMTNLYSKIQQYQTQLFRAV
jgi:hypothetical protein